MAKITFMGAGSTIFAKSILGDSLLTPALQDAQIALYDIDPQRLDDSKRMLDNLNANINDGRAGIFAYLGVDQRKDALRGADFVVNAIQVGGYEPSTVIDFEVPKKYGLRQTIGDTLGIGGIFRSLRTIPVVLDFARDMEEVCPDAWLLNYVNPMAMITGAVLTGSSIRTVGLCHSVQGCAEWLIRHVGMNHDEYPRLRWRIAGINHQAWLLEISHDGQDLYPEIKRRATEMLARDRRKAEDRHHDLVRMALMLQLGYYVTESSEHSAEYCPWFIKSTHPELIGEYHIPLDEYPRRCVGQIAGWDKQREALVSDAKLEHKRTGEFGSFIMSAIETDEPYRIHGSVINRVDGASIIPNLPPNACVEVPCLVDRNGVQPCRVGCLPEPCAALNRTNINVQLLTIEAALTGRKDRVYQAAMMDPHTASELSIDQIRSLCDDLIDAHGEMLPEYK